MTDAAPARAQTPDDLAALGQAHAASLARYDALSMLRNASVIANAGFSKALEAALTGNIQAAQAGLASANAVLVAATAFWQAVDAQKPYDGAQVQALINQLSNDD